MTDDDGHTSSTAATISGPIWRTADLLNQRMKDHPLTPSVVGILNYWWDQLRDDEDWQRLLNKSNLLQEVEESMVALGFLLECLEKNNKSSKNDDKFVLCDVCGGKGIFSLLASFVFQNDTRITKIILLDKPNFDMSNINNNNNNGLADWSYISVLNTRADVENRPIIETHHENLFETDKVIERLHSSSSSSSEQIALVGIHLCKNLSPQFVGIANSMDRVKILILAPCCLPRVVVQKSKKNKSKERVLDVAQYESPLQRQARLQAAQRRRNAQYRHTSSTRKCILCQSTNHTVSQCHQLTSHSREEQAKILQRAAALEPCWRCGELGHKKKDCPSLQVSGLPTLIPRPVVHLDVSQVMSTDNPFLAYCNLLSSAIDRKSSVKVLESGLLKINSSNLEHDVANWNGNRKTIFIVATND